jgi:hypothetical protein
MQSPQRDWHPAVNQHLQVRHLCRSIGEAGVCEPRQERSIAAAGQLARQQIHPDTRQHHGAEQRAVVRENGVARGPVDRSREYRDAQQVLRPCQCVRGRKELRGLPPAAQAVQEPFGVPRQDPGVQQRVAKGPGQAVARRRGQGPEREDGNRRESAGDKEPFAGKT